MTSPYTEEQIIARIQSSIDAGALALKTRGHFSKDNYFYFTFVNGKWLGGCYIRADTHHEAMFLSHTLGINPGGEVQMMGPIPAVMVKDGFDHRLITDQDELENAFNPNYTSGEVEGELPNVH